MMLKSEVHQPGVNKIKRCSAALVGLALLLAGCSRSTGAENAPITAAENVTRYAEVPDESGVFQLGLAFDHMVSLSELSKAVGESPVVFLGGKVFIAGGGGTFTPRSENANFDTAVKDMVETYQGFARSDEQRNKKFLAEHGKSITAAAVQSNPAMAALVQEGVVSVQRVERFNDVQAGSPIFYSVALKASKADFQHIKEQIGGVTMFRSRDGLTPPRTESLWVTQSYNTFRAQNYKAINPQGKLTSQAAGESLFSKFKQLAKEHYNYEVGGNK
jgi:hypothetical protein